MISYLFKSIVDCFEEISEKIIKLALLQIITYFFKY